jgi:UDP-N-acetylglucosamine 2-epimerase (non-hydrolysing)
MKTVVTVVGIRPDFIRMSEIFKKLDQNFDHLLIHTGQHYDELMSDVFFRELEIRKPDYNLCIGGVGKEHFHQTADISVKLVELFRKENIKPDTVMFLGDSNSVMVAPILKKEGYHISHVEAGMRSYDKRMLEEINRTMCDHCSDIHFVYHEDYKQNLLRENLPGSSIYNVGNTIVEVCNKIKPSIISFQKNKDFILMDIHRPENFKYKGRLYQIIDFANRCGKYFCLPVKMLKFGRTLSAINEFDLDIGAIELIDLMSYYDFLKAQYNSAFMISDSGTASEEPSLLGTRVIVPRDFTERPQAYWNGCAHPLILDDINSVKSTISWIQECPIMDTGWLGNGTTSQQIVNILKEIL